MRKLKECKNFGELYETIGEDGFGNVAFALIILLILAPLVAGVINFMMLQDFYNYIALYDAYAFNYKCMPVWNVIFMLMLLWTLIYVIGKIRFYQFDLKGSVSNLKEKHNWLLWWLALLVWTIIPVAFSVDPQGAFMGISHLGSGYISHIHMFGVMGCAMMVTRKEKKEDIIWAFISIMDVLSVIMIAYEYDVPFLGRFSAAPGVSVYTNSNHFGYMLTMSCVACTGLYYKLTISNEEKQKRRIAFCLCSFVIQAFSIIINDTLGSYLAIVFTLILLPFIWKAGKKKMSIVLWIPLGVLLLLTILSYQGLFPTKLGSTIGQSLVVFVSDLFKVKQKTEGYRHAGTDRIGLWIDTIKRISEKPIVGYGPDIVVDRENNYIIWNTPHNEFLECAFFLGIPGLVLYLGGLISLCIKKCKNITKLSMNELMMGGIIIGYLASSFFGVRKYNTVCYFFVFIGLLAGGEKMLDNDRTDFDGTSVK